MVGSLPRTRADPGLFRARRIAADAVRLYARLSGQPATFELAGRDPADGAGHTDLAADWPVDRFGHVEPSQALRAVSDDRSAAFPRRLPGRQPRRRSRPPPHLHRRRSLALSVHLPRRALCRSCRRRSFADSLADARVVAPAGRPLPDTDRGSESLPMVDVRAGLFDSSQAESRIPEIAAASTRP